jgi:hypothetical protein
VLNCHTLRAGAKDSLFLMDFVIFMRDPHGDVESVVKYYSWIAVLVEYYIANAASLKLDNPAPIDKVGRKFHPPISNQSL